jgi:hypothetical protein
MEESEVGNISALWPLEFLAQKVGYLRKNKVERKRCNNRALLEIYSVAQRLRATVAEIARNIGTQTQHSTCGEHGPSYSVECERYNGASLCGPNGFHVIYCFQKIYCDGYRNLSDC